jgi:hypothetical protein
MKLLKYTVLAVALCAAFTVQQAKATAITTFESILNVGNDAGLGLGPYGTVDVSLTGQTATITFTANTAGGFFFGDGSSAAVDVNSTSFTEGNLSETPDNSPTFQTGLQQVDGFGKFNLTVNDANFSVHVSTITFTVTNNLGTWVTASDVLTFNALHFDAAAHIFSTVGGITGFAGENGTGVPTVPDSGTTAMLLGGALAGLGAMRRYLKR